MFVDYTGLPGRLARGPMGYFLSFIHTCFAWAGPGSRVGLGVSRCTGLVFAKRRYGTDYCFASADSACCGMSEPSTRGVEC